MSLGVVETESYSLNLALILGELKQSLAAVSESEIETAQRKILAAKRVFVTGAGRSGLALRMAAMRLMHLGLDVHVAGEVTAPAIASGDLLLVASGSGTTAGAVHAAEVARKVGAEVLALTAARESKLAQLAQSLIVIPAALCLNRACCCLRIRCFMQCGMDGARARKNSGSVTRTSSDPDSLRNYCGDKSLCALFLGR